MEILVLVDYHSLYRICRKKELNIDEVFRRMIEKIEKRGVISEVRLFVPSYQQNIFPWQLVNHLKLAYGFSVELCAVLRLGEDEEKYKDLVDTEVGSWITKYVQPNIGPELVIFVASDGHFIQSWNEVKRKKKETEFLLLDPETASWAILKYAPFQILDLKKEEETNPFAFILKKRLGPAATLEEEEKKRMKILKRIQKTLSSLPQYGLNPETTKKFLTENMKDKLKLDIKEEEIEKAIEGLINLRAIRLHPIYSIDHNSSYWQWLEFFETE
jgi:hypothetical protein